MMKRKREDMKRRKMEGAFHAFSVFHLCLPIFEHFGLTIIGFVLPLSESQPLFLYYGASGVRIMSPRFIRKSYHDTSWAPTGQ